jgi:hypothetical protein
MKIILTRTCKVMSQRKHTGRGRPTETPLALGEFEKSGAMFAARIKVELALKPCQAFSTTSGRSCLLAYADFFLKVCSARSKTAQIVLALACTPRS